MKRISLSLIEFLLLLLFFGIIPYILFFETFPITHTKETTSLSLLGFGFIVGAILIFICVKRFIIDTRMKDLGVRIGILKDKAATESDAGVIIKCHRRIAWFKNLQTVINMIIPILAVVLTAFMFNNLSDFITKVCQELSEAQTYIKRLNHTVSLAATSFAIGVFIQFVFPWLQYKAVMREKLKGTKP